MSLTGYLRMGLKEAILVYQSVRRMPWRVLLQQIFSAGLVFSTALMIWKGLMLVSNSESPIVVVLSGSMEPAFYRGDLLFLTLYDDPIRVGDICVFKVDGRSIPIVHRVLKVHERPSGAVDILTKGDHNLVDDRGLYPPGQLWLHREHIVGRAKAFLPSVGMVTILMNDYPFFKYFLMMTLALFIVVNRE